MGLERGFRFGEVGLIVVVLAVFDIGAGEMRFAVREY